jgi:hypothetical protein
MPMLLVPLFDASPNRSTPAVVAVPPMASVFVLSV